MIKRVLLGCVVVASLAAACGGDDGGDEGGGGTNCGVETYTNFIQPLFNTNCIACHAATPVGNTVRLDSLASVKEHEHHVIEHAVELEAPSMPYMLPPLPQTDRDKIENWYACGAPQ
jgi:uncharacterized membrane protein